MNSKGCKLKIEAEFDADDLDDISEIPKNAKEIIRVTIEGAITSLGGFDIKTTFEDDK